MNQSETNRSRGKKEELAYFLVGNVEHTLVIEKNK
jgi:hypothetical protein